MAASTARYRFEFRLHHWAAELSRTLCGERRALFVGVRPDGSVRRVYCASPDGGFDPAQKEKLVGAHGSWLLYTPHDQEGSAYLEWFELDQRVAELWMGSALGDEDLVDVRSSGNRESWPSSWRVLFS